MPALGNRQTKSALQGRIFCLSTSLYITHNKKQVRNKQQMPQLACDLCQQPSLCFPSLIRHSLMGKHASTQNLHHARHIDEIMEQAISPVYIQYQDDNFYDNDEEFMKRQYKSGEFQGKIGLLSEYYKFHRDLPVWNDRHVEGVMARYYSKLKDIDYKKIKSVLKKQQGISLTTHQSFSSFDDQDYTPKSRYSTMLDDLNSSSQTIFLKDVCTKIGKAFKKLKMEQNNFKGQYYSGQKKFEQFLKKQKKRKDTNSRKWEQNKKNDFGFKKIKFNPKLNTRHDDPASLKQIAFTSNHLIKEPRYTAFKHALSNERTTANQTISREEKTKKDKSRSSVISTSRQNLHKKNQASRDHIIDDLVSNKFKSVRTLNLANLLSKQNTRNIQDIYKPTESATKKQKPSTQLSRKNSTQQLVTRLKSRSNSHHNLQMPQAIKQDIPKKDMMNSLKTNRSVSKKVVPISAAKGSVIQLQNLAQGLNDKALTSRQSSQRILRSSSSGKLSTVTASKQRQYSTAQMGDKVPHAKPTIEKILERKLTVTKRKHAVL